MKTKLQIMREKRNLTQKELAEKAGVNFRTFQRYDAADKSLSGAAAATVLKISDALECDPHEILEDYKVNEDRDFLIREKKRLLKRIEKIDNFLNHGLWFEQYAYICTIYLIKSLDFWEFCQLQLCANCCIIILTKEQKNKFKQIEKGEKI